MGRSAAGIIGMRLENDDYIIGMDIVKPNTALFVITDKGYGKRVPYNNFVNKGRGGKGMAYLKITDKNGASAGIRSVMPTDEIIITSQSGMTIRLQAGDISSQGRSTVGIRLRDINDTDTVSDFAVRSEDQD
jgi:DNA gyrase subunit A